MSEIKTEYRGYPIRYSENEDVWNCYDLGGFVSAAASAPTLSALKAKIDAFLLAERKASAVPCLILSRSHRHEVGVTEGKVLEYIGPKVDRHSPRDRRRVVGHTIAVMAHRPGRERVSRQGSSLSRHAPVTEAVRAAIDRANALGKIALEADTAFRKAFDAIPRLGIADIETLVRISGKDPSGGIKEEDE